MNRKTVLLVDDDPFFLQSLKALLSDEGLQVHTAASLSEGRNCLGRGENIDAVIIDIMMPSDDESDLDTHMGYKSGLVFARWVKNNYPSITIIGMSGVRSLDVVDWFDKHGAYFIDKGSGEAVELLNNILRFSPKDQSNPPQIFIVHGHDEVTKYALKNYLQNTLHLPEPIILHEQPSMGRTIIEKLEEITQQVNLVFVLLTPDDLAQSGGGSDDGKRRARQNVIFEMGYFLGRLPRKRGRVLLLYKGALDIPTDISGVIYIDISKGIETAGELIRKELSAVL